jgi:hypothetical protein
MDLAQNEVPVIKAKDFNAKVLNTQYLAKNKPV